MVRALDDPTFIIQICYGVIALPLYIATFVAILRTKARKGTFFRFYMACGIVVGYYLFVEAINFRISSHTWISF